MYCELHWLVAITSPTAIAKIEIESDYQHGVEARCNATWVCTSHGHGTVITPLKHVREAKHAVVRRR